MRCFSCDRQLESPYLDRPTGRFYCIPCFEPTNDEIMRRMKKENNDWLDQQVASVESAVDVEELDIYKEVLEASLEYPNIYYDSETGMFNEGEDWN